MRSTGKHLQSHTNAYARLLSISLFAILTFVSNPSLSWAVQVSPSSLSFIATQGGANPPAQNVSFSKISTKQKSWTAVANMAWVSVTPASGKLGTETDTITVSANVAGLAAGSYPATVTITLKGDGNQPNTTVPVSLTVSASTSTTSSIPTTPIISLSSYSLSFSGIAGGSNPAVQSINISNGGGGTLGWSTSDNATWLSLSPTTGTNSGSVNASVNISGMSAGTYSATVTVSATGATTQTIPVSLTLTSASTGSVTLSWTANAETDLAGYKLYLGTQTGVYGAPLTLGNLTTYQITNLTMGTTYFFSISAYDTAGNESLHSAEVSKSIY